MPLNGIIKREIEMTIKTVAVELAKKFEVEGIEVALNIIKKQSAGEKLREINDDGSMSEPLLFPNWYYLYDCLSMCSQMQKEKYYTAGTVIDYWLIFLHQTPEGSERIKLLNKMESNKITDNAVALTLIGELEERKKMLQA